MSEKLRRMDDERIGSLETKVDIWIETSKESRKVMFGKLDGIQKSISDICLGCSEHAANNKSVASQLKWLWIIVFTATCSILSLAFAFIGIK